MTIETIALSGPGADHLDLTVEDGVGTLTLARPDVLNALDSDTHWAIQRAVDKFERMEGVRSLVVRGSGRSFCAGSDLREIGNIVGEAAREYVALDFRTKNRIAGCSLPTIAAIHGHCVGGGVELALACDIRLAATDVRFAFREVQLGSLPGSGGLQRLPSVVGLGVAKAWVLLGGDVAGPEAERRGLVTATVDEADLWDHAQRLARQLAQQSPTAMRLAKVALDPSPPADYGMEVAFQMLAGEACHGDPAYQQRTRRFTAKATEA
ncbi:MAG: enoyl-CoA hydratase/isomerase family protein [Dehalococcoidia bacterium]